MDEIEAQRSKRSALTHARKTKGRFETNQKSDEEEDLKMEFGDNKAIEKSMRSNLTSQVGQQKFLAGKGRGSDLKSQGATSKAGQQPSHRSRKTAAKMNKKETIVDEEESYYDQQEEYESEYDEEASKGNPFQNNMAQK